MGIKSSKPLGKKVILTIVLLSFLLGTLPLLVSQTQKSEPTVVKAASLALKQYPGLDWSTPNNEKVSVLLDDKTQNAKLVLATGEKSSSIVTADISDLLYKFYNSQLLAKGFSQLKLVGNPRVDKYWVANYRNGQQYAEIEYYPTPYKIGSSTAVLFFGVLPKDS